MKIPARKLLAALVTGGAMLLTLPAHADRDRWRGDDHSEWRGHDREWRGHDRVHRHGHYKKFRDYERVVIRERIIEHRPIVREYRYYERPVEYYAPAPVYSRDPALVIGVSIPPIIIPFR